MLCGKLGHPSSGTAVRILTSEVSAEAPRGWVRGATPCIISLMATDECVEWQQLKEGNMLSIKEKLFLNFCFLQLLLRKHHIKSACRDLNGTETSLLLFITSDQVLRFTV